VSEAKAVQKAAVEPGRQIQVAALVGDKPLFLAVGDASAQVGTSEDASHQFGSATQFCRHESPSLVTRVGNPSCVNEHSATAARWPTAHFDGFEAMD